MSPKTEEKVSLNCYNFVSAQKGTEERNLMAMITEERKKFSHFKHDERLALEFYLKGSSHFPKITDTQKLAEIFNKSRRSIQREIKRGLVEHETSTGKTKTEYNADYAQSRAEYEMTAKGAPLKLGNDAGTAAKIAGMILNDRFSPYAVVQTFKKYGWPAETRFCEKTLYNYIERGLIEGVSVRDLPNRGKRRSGAKAARRYSRAGCALRSISNRPEWINDRSECGHWEIDTVKSRAGTTAECALTLTERKTRAEIIRKMPNGEAASVIAELDKIEGELGMDVFRKLFRSITADGGSEFLDFDGMEKSADGSERTVLYFAHPYCAGERGTNENHNRIFRRFYPKGTDFSRLPPVLFTEVQDWMNRYPRRILNGSTPELELRKYMGDSFRIPI